MVIIQKPEALSLSGNMKKFIVSSGSQIVFELKEGVTTLLSATYEPGADGRVSIDVKDIIENRLSYTLSHDNSYEQTNIVKTFTAIIDGSSHTFKVIRAGIANLADTVTNWLRGNFLTWQPANKQITYYSPEWITYYAQEACTVKLKATFPDAEQTHITLGSCDSGKAFTFNLQYAIISGLLGQKYPTHYDVWVENSAGTRLTYIQRYLYSEQKTELEQWFLFENSLGGLDTIRTSGDTDFTGEYDHKLSSTDNISSEYQVDTKRVYNQNTGYLDDYERRWLLDFFPATQKYIYHVSTIRKIVVTDSDVKYSASTLPTSYNFSYHFIEENEAALLNLIRNQESIPASITLPNLDSPDFHLPPRLSEYPRVPLHEGVLLPAFDPNSEDPKITTIGAIIAKAIEEVLNNIPGSDGAPGSGGQMVNIVREDDISSGTDNTVYSSLRTLREIQKALENISETLDQRYLLKINYDTAQKIINFIEGIEIGNFSSGPLGSGAAIKNVDGITIAEVDQLKVRMRAEFLSVLIHQAKHIGGELVQSAAEMICIKVEETTDFYRCYFDADDGKVVNLFENTDFARHQVFTGSKQKFYWRKIVAVGPDYIELSKTDAAINSDIPEVGDYIYQLGSENTERQGAIILSTVGPDAPSIKQYVNINTYALSSENEYTVFSRMGNKIQGKTVFRSNGLNYDDWADGTSQDIQDAQAAAAAAALKAQQAIDDAEASVTDYNAKFAEIQAQVDGEISNYSYPYKPTLLNYPASEWTSNEEKDRHIGDTFYNSQAYVDGVTTPDAGKAWRFVKNTTTYSWTPIADSDAVKALQDAAKAQAMADGKNTTYFFKPDTPKADGYCYKLGDMWVLNSDQTVNGIAYKQGDILTATQDSTTYNQAHWVKRVRYTDDTAVNELEIGGRNYAVGSKYPHNLIRGSYSRELVDGIGRYEAYGLNGTRVRYLLIEVPNIPMGDYTFSIKGRLENKAFNNAVIEGGEVTNGSLGGILQISDDLHVGKITINKNTNEDTLLRILLYQNRDSTTSTEDAAVFWLDWYKLEKGNKATDWSPAPEDVQAEINDAKQEALTAAGNAQNTANSLKDFTDTAFRDGIIDRSESIAIEKYKNSLNEAMAKAEASYNKVYINTYLEGAAKTSLLNAKVNLWGQRDTLLSAINTAISGGITTPAQKTAVDNAFSTFNNLITAFQNALEEANKAIQTKLDDLSTEKVDNIEIGGRNLIVLNKTISGMTIDLDNGSITSVGGGNHTATDFIAVVPSKRYIISVHPPKDGYQQAMIGKLAFYDDNKDFISAVSLPTIGTTNPYIFESTADTAFIRYSTNTNYALPIEFVKLEKANKPSDWTPAPEDVDKKISDVDAKAAEAQAKANKSAAITDKFATEINGGLITTVMMLLREANSQINTAGFSGIQKDVNGIANQPSYWSGGTYEQAMTFVPFVKKLENEQSTSLEEYNNLPSIVFLHSGAAKVGHFIVLTSGEILVVDPATGSVKLKFTTADLPAIEDLVSGVNSNGSTAVGGGVASISSSQVVSGSTVVSKNGAIATFNGTHISLSARGVVQAGGMASFAEAVLYARQNGVRVQRLASVTVHFTNTVYEDKSAEVLPVPFSFPLDAGTYTFELVIHTTGTISSGNAVTSASTLSWKHTVAGVKKQQYSKDGMMFFYSNRHFYFNELTGLDVKESDSKKFNLPGVLAAGSSTSGGIQSNVWGAKASTVNITPITGGFRVPLSGMSHSNYVVQITPHTNTTFRVGTKTSTYFEVYGTGGFDYVVIGNNYA